jgi:hypothetical protein
MRLIAITLIGLLFLLVACGSPQSRSAAAGGSGTGGNGSNTSSGDCSDGPARGPTQSCCPKLGIDACGAGLICAALDGRTVAVCYAEESRMAGETCTDDKLCVSSSCNMTLGKCRYPAHVDCPDATLGCAPDQSGTPTVCATNNSENPPACWSVGGTTAPCPYCITDADCSGWQFGFGGDAVCVASVCRGPSGTPTEYPDCCTSGSTVQGKDGNSYCA